ncbi:MAG: hypothetical protein NTY57_07075 [Solirubrobacterales bacterium]|nr:hypothetical protein [Solirubrobacterales bacterium]
MAALGGEPLMAVAISVPMGHLGHWAGVFYAVPVILLLLWAGVARLVRLRKARGSAGVGTDPSSAE